MAVSAMHPGYMSSNGVTRPQSEQVYDLHVYLIPSDMWRHNLQSAINDVITDSISLGFIRVSPRVYLQDLRDDILQQIGADFLPKDYVFLKSVGRCLTQVKSRQERELQAKHFLPPYAYSPELYLLDGQSDSVRESPSTISLSDSGHQSHRTGGRNTRVLSDKSSPYKHGLHNPDQIYGVNNSLNMGSQLLDSSQTPRNQGYPTHQQPYSHDISAITNAHRNRIGDDRKYNDNTTNSSGYKTMSPPYGKSPDLHSKQSRYDAKDSLRENGHEGSPRSRYSRSRMDRHGNPIPNSELAETTNYDGASTQREHAEDPRSEPKVHHSNERSPRHSDAPDGKGSHSRDASPSKSTSKRVGDPSERELMSATPSQDAPYGRGQGHSNRHGADKGGSLENRAESSQVGSPPATGTRSADGVTLRDGPNKRDDGYTDEDIDQFKTGNMSEEKRLMIEQLEKLREQRESEEKKRSDLVKKARSMQIKTNNRRTRAREVWKKKYYDEKKKTPPLEAGCQKIRATLDSLHKKYLQQLGASEPQNKENQALEEAKVQFVVDDLQRRSDAAKMKLTAEMKLRNQAETELRALRAELTQKKMSVSLVRSQQLNALGNSRN